MERSQKESSHKDADSTFRTNCSNRLYSPFHLRIWFDGDEQRHAQIRLQLLSEDTSLNLLSSEKAAYSNAKCEITQDDFLPFLSSLSKQTFPLRPHNLSNSISNGMREMREVHNPQCVLSFLHLSSLSPWLVNNLLIARTRRAPLPYSTKWSLLIFRLFQLCVSMDFLVDHVGRSAFLVGVGSHGD